MLDRLLTALLTLVLTVMVSAMGHVAFRCKGHGERHVRRCCPTHAPAHDETTSPRVERPRCCTVEHDDGTDVAAHRAEPAPTEARPLANLRDEVVVVRVPPRSLPLTPAAARGPPRPASRAHRVLFSSFLL